MKTMADDDSFLSRWSRRKTQTRQRGAAMDAPEPLLDVPASTPVPAPAVAHPEEEAESAPERAQTAPPPPTLDDVATLTHGSDFTRFMAPEVSGEVRNAALKKLFSDPHFNVMDGLDTYIDDYNKPDPLPASMLRQMAQAAYLGLVEPEPEKPRTEASGPRALADSLPNECAAGNAPAATSPADVCDAAAMKAHDEDPDLRLQSLHDPGPPGAEPRAGEDARREH